MWEYLVHDALGVVDSDLVINLSMHIRVPDFSVWATSPRRLAPMFSNSKAHYFLLFSHFDGCLGVASRNKSALTSV